MRSLALAALLVPALLAADPEYRPARTTDLPGVWMVVAMATSAPPDPDDKTFAPYQIFGFDRQGGMKHMTSTKPFREGQIALFNAAPQVTRYSVEKDGTLVLSNPSWDVPLKYQCRVVVKADAKAGAAADAKSPQAGDVLLVSMDDQGREAWSKLLRKVP
jgi:hypothetical protein